MNITDFKTRGEIYNEMVTALVAASPDLTSTDPHAPHLAILRVVANVLGFLVDVVKRVFLNQFAHYADAEALRLLYGEYGLIYAAGTELDDARRDVLSAQLTPRAGLPAYYEQTTIYNFFKHVNFASFIAGYGGPTTHGIAVGYNAADVESSIVTAVEAFWAAAGRRVLPLEIVAINYSDYLDYLMRIGRVDPSEGEV